MTMRPYFQRLLLKLTAVVISAYVVYRWYYNTYSLNMDTVGYYENLMPLEDDRELQDALSLIEKGPVVNPHPYSYLINNERLCTSSSSTQRHHGNPFLLIYVHTTPENSARRQLLRQTWAQPELYRPDFDVRIVYFIGRRRDNPVLEQAVQQEAAQFGDIIQSDFEDSYRNLTQKAVAAVHWIASFCNRTRYVLKTDDDVLVNVRALLKHLGDIDGLRPGGPIGQLSASSDDRKRRQSLPRRLILCPVNQNMTVMRGGGMYGVSTSEFSADVYPDYCSGMTFVMTVDLALSFSRVAYRVIYFRIDDVFLTGLLPERLAKAGAVVDRVPFDHVYLREDEASVLGTSLWYGCFYVRIYDSSSFTGYWTQMEAAAQRYPIPDVKIVRPGLIAGRLAGVVVDI